MRPKLFYTLLMLTVLSLASIALAACGTPESEETFFYRTTFEDGLTFLNDNIIMMSREHLGQILENEDRHGQSIIIAEKMTEYFCYDITPKEIGDYIILFS